LLINRYNDRTFCRYNFGFGRLFVLIPGEITSFDFYCRRQMNTSVKFRHISIILHTLIWGAVLLLPYLVSTSEQDFKIGPIPGLFFTVAGVIHMAIFYLNAYYLIPKLLNRRLWWLYLPASVVLIVVSFQLKYLILAQWFPDVLRDMTAYKFVFGPSVAIYFISIIYRKVVDKIRYDREQQKIRAAQLSSELKFLRSQISPHFLFNVLTNLVSLARKKSDQMEPSLLMLSELMRYMLYDTKGQKVALSKEISYLNNYIALQKLRFGNEVEILYHIDAGTNDEEHMIEPMLLVPFVENAFKHGVVHLENPKISISLSVKEDILIFEVLNQVDDQPEASKDESSGIGLANVRSRLEMLYKNRHNLKIKTDHQQFHIHLTLMLK